MNINAPQTAEQIAALTKEEVEQIVWLSPQHQYIEKHYPKIWQDKISELYRESSLELAAEFRRQCASNENLDDLKETLKKLSAPNMIHVWSLLTASGMNELEFVKLVHRNLVSIVMRHYLGSPSYQDYRKSSYAEYLDKTLKENNVDQEQNKS